MREFLDRFKQLFTVPGRQTSYRFGSAALRDLAIYCRATETTFDPDPRVHAYLEGRRDVWLRIAKHCRLSEEQVMLALYSGGQINHKGE